MSKAWFITGAGSGIGAATARAALKAGDRVVATGRKEVLMKLTGMETPPRVFVTGSDALAVVGPAVEARLKAVHAFEELSKSTDGSF